MRELTPSALNFNASSISANLEWENEWNTSGLPSRLSESEYKARKRQRIHKRIHDLLRHEVQSSEKQQATKATSADLLQMITEISNKGSSAKRTDTSRFAHTERLQFTQVCFNICFQRHQHALRYL